MNPRGRILAIDLGSKNVGLAVSDPLGLTAQGLPTLKRTNKRADLGRIRELAEAYQVERILVGHPLHLKGYAGARAEDAARFADRLRRELRLPIELFDERLTSVEAESLLRQRRGHRPPPPSPKKRKQHRQAVDRIAACLILQTYLDQKAAGPDTVGAEAAVES